MKLTLIVLDKSLLKIDVDALKKISMQLENR